MGVVPGVLDATFDIPTETFVVHMAPGGAAEGVAAAIREAGYVPRRVTEEPRKRRSVTKLPDATSAAVKRAVAESRSQAKPILIKFGGPFCRLCRRFEERVLADEAVRDRLSTEFVFLEIDTEEDEDVATSFGVRAVPDFWLIGPGGDVVARENRYLNVEEFLGFLDQASPR